MDQRVRARVKVYGVVQGVYFRGAAQEEARHLGLDGWVSNRPDGSVEAVFEGPEYAVREAVEWMSHGPTSAIVEHIVTEWEEPTGETGFGLRY
ncbi:MAG TPA: acylphosphatase [Coriobacteriia bacterium]|jgi:acylphosphatase